MHSSPACHKDKCTDTTLRATCVRKDRIYALHEEPVRLPAVPLSGTFFAHAKRYSLVPVKERRCPAAGKATGEGRHHQPLHSVRHHLLHRLVSSEAPRNLNSNKVPSLCSASCVRRQRGTARIRTPLLLSAGVQQSIDISCMPGPQQRRSDVALVTRHRRRRFIHIRAHGLRRR